MRIVRNRRPSRALRCHRVNYRRIRFGMYTRGILAQLRHGLEPIHTISRSTLPGRALSISVSQQGSLTVF